jgi:hypothetical protein
VKNCARARRGHWGIQIAKAQARDTGSRGYWSTVSGARKFTPERQRSVETSQRGDIQLTPVCLRRQG